MAFGNPYGYNQPNYPTYFPQGDQMAQYRAQQYVPQMNAMQAPQMPQAQQTAQGAPIWVQGEAGAKSFLVAPGQSLILMDSEAEVFYIKSTDASGVPMPLRIFDYKERTGAAQRPAQAAQMPVEQYVTRAEYDALAAKLADVTARLEAMIPAPAPRNSGAAREYPQKTMRRETEDMIDA